MSSKSIKVQLTLRLPCELNEHLKRISEQRGITKNSIIITSLWNYVRKESVEKWK